MGGGEEKTFQRNEVPKRLLRKRKKGHKFFGLPILRSVDFAKKNAEMERG